ncbi:MAG: hypothetical protein K9J76_07940 [Polaromonas sp.]|nr:hypothetical protein [Polaromonas sp.]
MRKISTKRSKVAFIHANLPTDGKFTRINEDKDFEIIRRALTVQGAYRSTRPGRSFYEACEDIKPAKRFVVHAGPDRFPISDDVQAIGVRELADNLSSLS